MHFEQIREITHKCVTVGLKFRSVIKDPPIESGSTISSFVNCQGASIRALARQVSAKVRPDKKVVK